MDDATGRLSRVAVGSDEDVDAARSVARGMLTRTQLPEGPRWRRRSWSRSGRAGPRA